MSVDFRCENCGKLLTGIEAEPGSSVSCPHCHKKVAVPAGLAALPHPHLPTGGGTTAVAVTAPQPAPAGVHAAVIEEHHEDAMMTIMARFMPWLISIFFHVGLAMIMLFTVMMAGQMAKDTKAGNEDNRTELENEEVIIPDAEHFSDTPGGHPNPGPGGGTPDMEARQSNTPTDRKDGWAARESAEITFGSGGAGTGVGVEIIGGSGGGGGGVSGGTLAPYGLTTAGGSGAGPKSNFFGSGGNAHHVVYVIDRSGSMAAGGVFDPVKREIVTSVGKLKDKQGFHVILFSDTKQPVESPPRRVVAANGTNKREAAKFLEDIVAEGKTNPMPALERAFEVLENNTLPGKGKLIYLLTDGVFTVKNEEVVQFIRSRNKNKDVLINTYLYGHAPEEAVKVMKQISDENGGRYTFVEGD